jgi:predicted transcriptional regulator of viral defense system
MKTQELEQWIEEHVGQVFILTDLAIQELDSSNGIKMHLSRLVDQGMLKRLRKGIYFVPRTKQIFGKEVKSTPSHSDIIAALGRLWKTIFIPDGPVAAHSLGLTTQVPQHRVYMTKKSPYKEQIGNHLIELRKVSESKMLGAGTNAGIILSALEYLKNEMSQTQIKQIAMIIAENDMLRLLRFKAKRSKRVGELINQINESYEKISKSKQS